MVCAFASAQTIFISFVQNIIEYILFRLFSLLVRLFCWKRLSSIGKYFGRIIFYLFASRRKTAISNLRFAFPQKSDSEIYKLAKNRSSRFLFRFLKYFGLVA